MEPSNLLLQFDDLTRCFSILIDTTCEKEFLRYVSNQEILRLKWIETINECKRLKSKLDEANRNISKLDDKLTLARQLVDDEKQHKKRLELERDAFATQLDEVKKILLCDARYKLPDETKERLSFLQRPFTSSQFNRNTYNRLNMVEESDSVASLDFSFSRSGNDLLDETRCRPKRNRNYSFVDDDSCPDKRKKSLNPVVTYTPTAPSAESLESLPSEDVAFDTKPVVQNVDYHTPVIERINARPHQFGPYSSKLAFMRQPCLICSKKSRTMWKCDYCNTVAHPECCDQVPRPCAPAGTPRKGCANSIADYAPLLPPMIPSIVIQCVTEVELRGLKEIGIYRIPGSEAVVEGFKNSFMKGRTVLNLADENIHNVCSLLKKFLRDLSDPLIPRSEWTAFKEAIFDPEKRDKLYQAVSSLPQANRDTLAYLVLHLQHVARSPSCKMPISLLASAFGPTIFGFSNYDHSSAFSETHMINIMEELLLLSADYWASFISMPATVLKTPCTLRNTPSTESLAHRAPYHFLFTPRSRTRFFQTPPLQK